MKGDLTVPLTSPSICVLKHILLWSFHWKGDCPCSYVFESE